MNPTEPPAIVRTAEPQAEMIAHARSLGEKIGRDERQTLQTAIELGRVLDRLRESCNRDWLAVLEKTGVKQQRASEYIRIARLPAAVVSACGSIREALERAADLSPKPGTAAGKAGSAAGTAHEKQERETAERQRRTNIDLIRQVDPDLADAIECDPESASDELIARSVPPSCDRCRQGDYPPGGRECPLCASIRADAQQTLFGSEREAEEGEVATASQEPPPPPPDPFAELKREFTRLSGLCTKAMKQHGEKSAKLHKYWSENGLVWHDAAGNPKFLPLVGAGALVDLASEPGPPRDPEVATARYREACGCDPPLHPRIESYRARKGHKS
jgi:hypothetical protein